MQSQKSESIEKDTTIKKMWVAPAICSLDNVNTELGTVHSSGNEGAHTPPTIFYSS